MVPWGWFYFVCVCFHNSFKMLECRCISSKKNSLDRLIHLATQQDLIAFLKLIPSEFFSQQKNTTVAIAQMKIIVFSTKKWVKI